MSVIASCGHDIANSESISLQTMDFTTDWEKEEITRCIRYGLYCVECATAYESYGIVLHSNEERDDWLSGSTSYPPIDVHA